MKNLELFMAPQYLEQKLKNSGFFVRDLATEMFFTSNYLKSSLISGHYLFWVADISEIPKISSF